MLQSHSSGGVAQNLDYDINIMSQFCSWIVFSLFKCTNTNASPHFQSLLHSVLSATRLPKSTVLLGIHYVSMKLELESEPCSNESQIFETLILGILLANKFNDDNTFKNKSWAEATGLTLNKINQLERDWLKSCCWNLHDDAQYSLVESCWTSWCSRFDQQKINHLPSPIPSSPIYYDGNDGGVFNSPINSDPISNYNLNNGSIYYPNYGYNYNNNYYSTNVNNCYQPQSQFASQIQLPPMIQQPFMNYYGYAAVY